MEPSTARVFGDRVHGPLPPAYLPGHLVSIAEGALSPLRAMPHIMRHRFSIDAFLDHDARAHGRAEPSELLRRLRESAALLIALRRSVPQGPPLRTKQRADVLRLRASDIDWSWGNGDAAEVSGLAEALILALTGRAAGLAGLCGPGTATLASRCEPSRARA